MLHNPNCDSYVWSYDELCPVCQKDIEKKENLETQQKALASYLANSRISINMARNIIELVDHILEAAK